MADPFQIPIPIKLTNPVHLDYYRAKEQAIGVPSNGWPSVAEAVAGIPQPIRYYGMIVDIQSADGIVQYWWRASLADAGLIPKDAAAAAAKLYTATGQQTDGAPTNKLFTDELAKKANTTHTHTVSQVTDFTSASDARIAAARGNTIAPLENGKVPAAFLPTYISDIQEYANLAAFPASGIPNTIYVALDTNLTYRWSGTQYTRIGDGQGVVSFNGRTGNVSLTQADVDAFLVTYNQRLTAAESDINQLEVDTTRIDGEVDTIQALIPGNATPSNRLVAQSDLAGLGTGTGSSTVDITPNRTLNSIQAGTRYQVTAQEYMRLMTTGYDQPGFGAFTFAGAGSRTQEIGTPYAAGTRRFAWSVANATNLKPNSISIREAQTNFTLASSLANDGQEDVTVPAFTITNGLTRQFVITGVDSNNASFTATLNLSGSAAVFYGAVDAAPTTSAGVRALPSSRLASDGNTFILNTGSVYRRFAIWVPSGKSLVSVYDIDSSRANVTSSYVATGVTTIQDAGGNNASGVLYVMTQAIPYTSNHSHEITLG